MAHSTGENRRVKTLRLQVNPAQLESPASRDALRQAAKILRQGGLVALPTETVYGLGANALDGDAVARIFEAKLRPSWDPIIVHIAGAVDSNLMLERLVDHPPQSAQKLMQAFWPGPLTLLLPRSSAVPDAVTAGRPLVGVRMPAHPVAFALILEAGLPIAAPSANVFGHISPTTAEHVLEDLDGRIDAILDAGPTQHGVESTVLDPNQMPLVIYRPGAITADQIGEIAGPVEIYRPERALETEPREALPSPGVGLRHYAPRAKLVLIDCQWSNLPGELKEQLLKCGATKTGIMLPAELGPRVAEFGHAQIFPWGRWDSPEELAHNLYAGLRMLDAAGCTIILCPLPPKEGLGATLRDRLQKAAR